MKIYEIIITNNNCDTNHVWHFKDSDVTEKSVKAFFKKELFAMATQTGCKPKHALLYPGKAESGELLHGMVQFDDFHLEATLTKYDEEVFFQKITADI